MHGVKREIHEHRLGCVSVLDQVDGLVCEKVGGIAAVALLIRGFVDLYAVFPPIQHVFEPRLTGHVGEIIDRTAVGSLVVIPAAIVRRVFHPFLSDGDRIAVEGSRVGIVDGASEVPFAAHVRLVAGCFEGLRHDMFLQRESFAVVRASS